MVAVIRNTGDPNHARTLNGIPVERKEVIWLPSHQSFLPVLQTSMHFCFRDASLPRGSTLFCTCGSMAVTVGYEAYRRWQSKYIGNEVIACHHFIMHGRHADNSHE